ncbi:MAG: menaquinone biosynthesis protein [Nitrospirae bacterium]|nr:menaquinone biosynthesis protein [Nitrospirota bacterium]
MLKKNKSTLKIGKIPYANLVPIYYYLNNKCGHSGYKFTRGVPSELNKMLRNGGIDVSPSSSIEYLRYKEKYNIIPNLSISSSGPICSIFLFSKLHLDELSGKTIAVSSDSETSVALLKIILREFYSLKCRFVVVKSNNISKLLSFCSACLLIGDNAMKARKTVMSCGFNPPIPPLVKGGEGGFLTLPLTPCPLPLFVYDLGELWFRHTGLPFVFALWMVRKKALSEKKELIEKLSSDLILAKKYAYKEFPLIAHHAPQIKWLSEKELVRYWKGISYDFTEKHMEGLRLFERYIKRLVK